MILYLLFLAAIPVLMIERLPIINYHIIMSLPLIIIGLLKRLIVSLWSLKTLLILVFLNCSSSATTSPKENMEGITNQLYARTGLTFTVNKAVPEVPLAQAGFPEFSNNGTSKKFAYGDHITLEGYEVFMPYQFGQGSINLDVSWIVLSWEDDNGNTGIFQEISNSLLNIPDYNVWFDTDIYIQTPSGADSPWWFEIFQIVGNVSMINSPAVLDSTVQNFAVHLKTRSTLPITF